MEGGVSNAYFQPFHGHHEEEEDTGNNANESDAEEDEDEGNEGSTKCRQLISELLAHCQALGIPF